MTISEHLIENAITRIEYGSEEFMQDPLLIEQSKEVGISMTDLWYITQYIRYVYRPDIECKTRDKCCTELVEKIKENLNHWEDCITHKVTEYTIRPKQLNKILKHYLMGE